MLSDERPCLDDDVVEGDQPIRPTSTSTVSGEFGAFGDALDRRAAAARRGGVTAHSGRRDPQASDGFPSSARHEFAKTNDDWRQNEVLVSGHYRASSQIRATT